MTETN